MTDYTISPAYEIINFLWTRLKASGVLNESDYFSESLGQTVMPILPVQQQPELMLDLGENTVFVYEYIKKPNNADFWYKYGQVIIYAYDNDFNKLAEIVEFIDDEFGRRDGSAAAVNSNLLSTKFDFKTVSLGSTSIDRESYDDNGRMSAEIIIDFEYTRLSTQATGQFD